MGRDKEIVRNCHQCYEGAEQGLLIGMMGKEHLII